MSRPHLEASPSNAIRGARTALAAAGVFLLVSVLVAGVVSAGAADRRAMALGPSYPQVSGDRVVWQDTATNNVVLSDVARDSTYAVPYARYALMQVGAGQSPGLDGTRLGVWDRNLRVRSQVLGSAPVTVSAASVAEQSVAVSGNRVAWVDIRNGPTAKRVYTATVGGAESRASLNEALQQSPALAGTLLAWEDKRNGDMDVYFRDLTTATVSNLTRPAGVFGDQLNPAVSGMRVVWEDGRSNKDGSKDIYMFDKASQSPGQATNLTPDTATTLTSFMPAGASSASVGSTAGFEVGDYVEIVTGSDIDRLRISSIGGPSTLNFSSATVYNHNNTNAVRVSSLEQRPDIFVDGTGYTVVWQTNRKSASTDNHDIRAVRYTSGGSLVATYQVTRTDLGDETRPRVDGWRIVYQLEVGGSSSIERYELMPFAYGDPAGGGTEETTRVPARASYAGHTATYRFGFGSTPGATDLSSGYSAETPSDTVTLIGSGSTPGSGEITVPAAAISLAEGTTYYVTAQVKENGSWGATATSSSVEVDDTDPLAPTNVAAVRDGGTLLTWNAASDGTGAGIDAYEVWRASVSPPATETVGETMDTTFRDDGSYGLTSAPASTTTYSYWITTRDKAGNHSSDAEAVIRPERPVPFNATAGVGQVALSWTNPSGDFAATRILQSTTGFASSPTPTAGQTQIYEGTGTSHTDTSLTNGTLHYYTAFARNTLGNWSDPATRSATPQLASTTLTLSSSRSLVDYNGATALSGTLKSGSTALAGRTVSVYRRSFGSGIWYFVGSDVTDGSGAYGLTHKLKVNQVYEARFAGDATYAADTDTAIVQCRAALPAPRTPWRVARYRPFTVYGYLFPRHYGKTKIVLYRYYRGQWRYYRAYYGWNRRYSSFSKYSVRIRVPFAGRWMVRAYHNDLSHYKTYGRTRVFNAV